MYRLILILLFSFFFSNCSIDTKTGVWKNKNEVLNNKNLSEISFSENLTFKKFKENAIQYGKQSDFPKLDD